MAITIPVRTVAEALRFIDDFEGPPVTFLLAVHESLLDPVGVNMALITDRALARGWEPNGFTQHNDYRVFRYKELA
jgi:hypothetical protein